MLIIRFSRTGKRNHAQYRIVVAEKSAPVKGKFVEQLGSYDPHLKTVALKEDRIKDWIAKGASCSDSVHNLLVEEGVLKEDKRKNMASVNKKKEDGDTDGYDKKDESSGDKDVNVDSGEEKKESSSVEAMEPKEEVEKPAEKLEEKTEDKKGEEKEDAK